MIIPDPPNQAMKSVELNLDRLNIANVDMGCQVIRRLGQYKLGENNQLEEIEEGELAGRVYNLYEFNVDDYNEWAKDEIVDFRPVLAFRGIRFLMRDLSQSILNDNFKFIKRPLGGTETIVDLSDFDKEYNVLANDSPWSTWLKVREQQNIGVNSNTISVDVQTAPNELDQDLVYDSFQPPATRDVNQVTEYFPQDYIIENGKVVREQAGISGYNLDLDIMCLRSITVQPAQYPYTFSIADYNTQNNTNYVGVRKVVVEGGSSSNITQITNYPITQNGIQNVPIPTGYDAVDSISLNVQVLPVVTYSIKIGSLDKIRPYEMGYKPTGSSLSYTVPNGRAMLMIFPRSSYCTIHYFYNGTGSSYNDSFSKYDEVWYYITPSAPGTTALGTYCYFYDSGDNEIIYLIDNSGNNTDKTSIRLNRGIVDFLFTVPSS